MAELLLAAKHCQKSENITDDVLRLFFCLKYMDDRNSDINKTQ